MSNQTELYQLMGRTLGAFAPFYQEGVARLLDEKGQPANWFALINVRYQEPARVTPTDFQAHYPYNAPDERTGVLAGLVEEGCLEEDAEGGYRLSDHGRSVIEGFFSIAHEALGSVAPLPAEEMERAASLLERLVQAVESAAEPAEKPSLARSRWTDPGPDSPPAVRIDQLVTDLNHFRDDAHAGAWRKYGVDGRTWETLSILWNEDEEADTATALAERLSNRGYDENDYANSLADLQARGWVEESDGHFQLTAAGREVREAAEEETDRLYFGAWSALSPGEGEELAGLLKQLCEKLEAKGQRQLWTQAREASGSIFQATRPMVETTVEKHFPPGTFGPVSMATGKGPDPLTMVDLQNRTPYASRERIEEIVAGAVEAGLLSANGGNGASPRYYVSPEGKTALSEVNDLFYRHLEEMDVLPQEDLENLAGLLERLVEASLSAEEPVGAWLVVNSRTSHPGKPYGPLARIDQHLDDLNAFRDDAHLAAWRDYGVDGRSWEALTLAWREGPVTAAGLAEQLPFRGHDEDGYAAALSQLVERGWLEEGEDGYAPTAAGSKVRQEAEEATDRLFFGPWSILEGNEPGQLRNLLIRLKIGLEKLVEEPAAA